MLENILVEEKDFMFKTDRVKAFQKLASSQFENPYDSIREVIANAIDSYYGLDVKKKKIEMELQEGFFQITDYGSGMNDKKMEILRTLGLTDKRFKNNELIGRFGIGFASLFNPKMEVEKVVVDTNNNGDHFELVFEVDEGVPSIKKYKIEDEIQFGTKVRIHSKSPLFRKNVERKINQTCEFLPHDIHLNNKRLNTKKIKKKGSYKTLTFNEDGIEGHLTFEPKRHYTPQTPILSHYLLVDTFSINDMFKEKDGAFKNEDMKGYYTKKISGIINYNNLRLVVSRNELIEDENYKKIGRLIKEKSRDLFIKLIEFYKKNDNEDIRIELIKNICNNTQDIRLVTSGLKEMANDRDLTEELINLNLFKVWRTNKKISLRELLDAKEKHGLILGAEKEEDLELFYGSGYGTFALRVEDKFSYINYPTTRNHLDPLLIGVLEGYNVSELDTGSFDRLIRRGVLDPSKFFRNNTILEDNLLEPKEKSFINNIRKIFQQEEVRDVLKLYKIPEDVNINYATYESRDDIIASYNPKKEQVTLNRDNGYVMDFVSCGDNIKAPLFFIPLMAHELMHDDVANHTEEFYFKKGRLDRDLKVAVSNYLGRC